MFVEEHPPACAEPPTSQEMRERLFRVATHDLKSPIANLRMVEYMLRDTLPDDPTTGQLIDTMQLSLDAMEAVIADFLDVVVLQSGKIDLRLVPVPLGQVICNGLLQYSPAADRKNIILKTFGLDGTVLADSTRLSQIVSNLISNAIKYSPRGSTISVWTEGWTEEASNKVRLCIADQGPGIPYAERSLLFTEFGKLTARPTGQETSTGLGLWIVKQLAEMMDGRVGVDCPSDGGSIFWVELPAC